MYPHSGVIFRAKLSFSLNRNGCKRGFSALARTQGRGSLPLFSHCVYADYVCITFSRLRLYRLHSEGHIQKMKGGSSIRTEKLILNGFSATPPGWPAYEGSLETAWGKCGQYIQCVSTSSGPVMKPVPDKQLYTRVPTYICREREIFPGVQAWTPEGYARRVRKRRKPLKVLYTRVLIVSYLKWSVEE
jgi:hypothetical protein